MPLQAAKLAAELEAIEPSGDDATAARDWANAFITYLVDMSTNGIPAIPSPIDATKSIMEASLTGMSLAGLTPLRFQAAVAAVWGILAPAASSIWPGAVAITPPTGNAGIAAAMLAVAPINVVGNLSKKDSVRALAEAIHTTQITGGFVEFPAGVKFPIL